MSGLYGGWRSCPILCFSKNCCTSFDECAGALPWWRSQSPLDQKRVFFSRHHEIFSELQRNTLCWSSDLLEQIRSAQHPHNRKEQYKRRSDTFRTHFVYLALFSSIFRINASWDTSYSLNILTDWCANRKKIFKKYYTRLLRLKRCSLENTQSQFTMHASLEIRTVCFSLKLLYSTSTRSQIALNVESV